MTASLSDNSQSSPSNSSSEGEDLACREYLEKRFKEIDGVGWAKTYNKLRDEAFKQESKLQLTSKDARSIANCRKNRYRDVLPYDDSRVRLGKERDYINASLVSVPKAQRRYILTQGPLEETSGDFWEMVWERNSHLIVMLNRCVEKNTMKCHQYFPTEKNAPMDLKNGFVVELLDYEQKGHFEKRELLLSSNSKGENQDSEGEGNERARKVIHFQFTTWPDFGVPGNTSDFLEFLLDVRKSNLLNFNSFGPTVVHCSAGIGRSGTFIIADSTLVMASLETSKCQDWDIYKSTLEMRKYRMGLIQTHDQLRFTWRAVLDALKDPQWDELVHTNCYNKETLSPPIISRSMGNTLCSGDHSKSVDSNLLSSPLKRSLKGSRSKMDDTEEEEEDGEDGVSMAPPRHKQSAAADFSKSSGYTHPSTAAVGGGGAAEEESSSGRDAAYESRVKSKEVKSEVTAKRVAEIKKRMKAREEAGILGDPLWRQYLGYGALAALSGVLAYYVLWQDIIKQRIQLHNPSEGILTMLPAVFRISSNQAASLLEKSSIFTSSVRTKFNAKYFPFDPKKELRKYGIDHLLSCESGRNRIMKRILLNKNVVGYGHRGDPKTLPDPRWNYPTYSPPSTKPSFYKYRLQQRWR